jgi:glucose/arabinose dehydrogenase
MNRSSSFALGLLVAGCMVAIPLSAPLSAAPPPACDPDNGGITLPAGFCAVVAVDGLGEARHIAVAPNGDVYVALLSAKKEGGGVVALRDTKGDGHFDMKETFGEGSSTGIGLRNGYLYVAKVNSVERYKMTPGQLKPTGAAEVVVSGLQGERQHGDKGLTFDGKGSLYVNRPDKIPAPSSKSTAASGSSMKTSWGKRRKMALASPPGCVRCRPSRGTMALCTSR